jgi:hypothetical protein
MLWVSRFGVALRGVTFALIGGFLMIAGWRHDSSEAHGLGGTLVALAHRPHGWVLLAIVACGLFSFGVYAMVLAKYRRIRAA